MKHTKNYMDAMWVVENPEKYDNRDVARANSFIQAYNEGYNQALSLGAVVATKRKCCSYFVPADRQTSATICETCGQEKHMHPQH